MATVSGAIVGGFLGVLLSAAALMDRSATHPLTAAFCSAKATVDVT